MGKIKNLSDIFFDNGKKELQIAIERNEEVYDSAYELSEYIESLSLDKETNNTLISLIANHVIAAEQSACVFGIQFAIKKIQSAKRGAKNAH